MDSEADRAQSVLRAIPQMSREIVDDTLYEKVFSFLKGFVESGNTQLLDSLGVFDILIQACEEEDQDYRVINLCYRILGTVVEQSEKDNVCIFDKLQCQHGSLLDRLLSDITNPQPAVRCAVLEALRSCLTCGHAAQWLLEREEIAKDISSLCTDGSTYIVDQFCQLYSLVLKLSPTSITYQKLLAALNPSNEIKSVLRSETSSPTTVHALDFCYSVANIQTSEAWRYMLDENLLQPLLPLLGRQDRIANDRILEILTVIFNWTPDPLLLLLEEPNVPTESSLDNAVQRAYHYIIEFSDTMMRQATHISTVQVAVSLLETSVELLKRLKRLPTEELYNALRGLLLLGTSLEVDPQKAVNTNILRLLNRAASARKLFLHDVLRALQTLFKTFSLTQAIPQLSEDIMATLNIRNLSSDKKVLQPALELFGILLDQFSAVETTYYTQSQLSKCVDILVDMLSDYSMKSQNVALVLKFIGSLLSNDKLSSFMLDPMTSGSLINTLELMIMNPEWDARDDAISFVGSLFDKPSLGAPIAFALSHDLPLQVMDLIQDPDTFVRASALEMLEKMMRVPEGWVYIQRHQRARDIARKLPSLLYDPESYVRRAALGSISCLIVNRSCEGMIIEKHPLHEKESLNKELVDELMGDPDSEVRLRVCRMLLDLWNLHLHTKEQQKRSRSDAEKSDEYQPFFYLLEGDKRLMEATEDTHRLVRKEAIHAIQTILQERHDDEDAKVAQKRKHGDEMDTDEELLRKFADLNLTALEESTQPEHLYAEALDVSSAMMTAQAPVTSEDNDGNQLDCYN